MSFKENSINISDREIKIVIEDITIDVLQCYRYCGKIETVSKHKHKDFFELIYIETGSCKVQIGEREYVVRDKSIVLVQPETMHTLDSPQDIVYFCLIFRFKGLFKQEGKTAPYINREMALIRDCLKKDIILEVDSDDEIKYLLNNIVREYQRNLLGSSFFIKTQILQAIILVARLFHSQISDRALLSAVKNSMGILFDDLEDYLEANISKHLIEGEITKELNVSVRHMNRLMQKSRGMTLHKYIMLKKLDKIKKELERGTRLSEELAESVGINSLSYLSKLFKKEFNLTPGEYRKKKGFLDK